MRWFFSKIYFTSILVLSNIGPISPRRAGRFSAGRDLPTPILFLKNMRVLPLGEHCFNGKEKHQEWPEWFTINSKGKAGELACVAVSLHCSPWENLDFNCIIYTHDVFALPFTLVRAKRRPDAARIYELSTAVLLANISLYTVYMTHRPCKLTARLEVTLKEVCCQKWQSKIQKYHFCCVLLRGLSFSRNPSKPFEKPEPFEDMVLRTWTKISNIASVGGRHVRHWMLLTWILTGFVHVLSLWRGAHFEIARATLSALWACYIALTSCCGAVLILTRRSCAALLTRRSFLESLRGGLA